MSKKIGLLALITLLSGCAIVTVPIKVAAKTVEVAVDVVD